MPSKIRVFLLLAFGLLTGISLGISVLIGGEYFSATNASPGNQPGTRVSGPLIGRTAPAFTARTVDGDEIHLSDFLGEPVILNFWATWCEPCRIEMPFFESRSRLLGDKLQVLAINAGEPVKYVKDFVDEFDLSIDIGIDNSGEILKTYYAIGLPRTYFIDKDGIILAQHIGAMSEYQLDEYIKMLGITDA